MENTSRSWKVVRSETVVDLKLFKARFDYMRNPRNEAVEKMIILESPDSVNVVPVTTKGEIIFVRQYRFGLQKETLELPGGLVDPGEDHGPAAQRELREETGYTGQQWSFMGSVGSNPVFMDSYIHHWQVNDIALTHEKELDLGEDIDLEFIPIDTVKEKLFSGAFIHPHTISALMLFFGKNKF